MTRKPALVGAIVFGLLGLGVLNCGLGDYPRIFLGFPALVIGIFPCYWFLRDNTLPKWLELTLAGIAAIVFVGGFLLLVLGVPYALADGIGLIKSSGTDENMRRKELAAALLCVVVFGGPFLKKELLGAGNGGGTGKNKMPCPPHAPDASNWATKELM